MRIGDDDYPMIIRYEYTMDLPHYAYALKDNGYEIQYSDKCPDDIFVKIEEKWLPIYYISQNQMNEYLIYPIINKIISSNQSEILFIFEEENVTFQLKLGKFKQYFQFHIMLLDELTKDNKMEEING